MSDAERVLSAEARARLDEHLDSVQRVLSEAGVPRPDRRGICDEVETQACEMAWQRTDGEPTEEHMKAVLAELDDPEAYREAATPSGPVDSTPPPDRGPRIHRFALCALLVPMGGLFLEFSPIPFHLPALPCLGVAASLSIAFAILAIRAIRREPDRYSGTAVAILGTLIVPLLALNTAAFYFAYHGDPWGINRLKARQDTAETNEQNRQARVASDGPDVPFEPLAKVPKDDEWMAVSLSESDKWKIENASLLTIPYQVAVIGGSAVLSILLLVVPYRLCRPRNRDMPTKTGQV